MYKIFLTGTQPIAAKEMYYAGLDGSLCPVWKNFKDAKLFIEQDRALMVLNALLRKKYHVDIMFIVNEQDIPALYAKYEYLVDRIAYNLAPDNRGLRQRLADEGRFQLGKLICRVPHEYNPLKGGLITWFHNVIRWELISYIYKWTKQVARMQSIEKVAHLIDCRESVDSRVREMSVDAQLVVGIVLSDRNRKPGNITIKKKLEYALRDRLGWNSTRIEITFLELQEEFS